MSVIRRFVNEVLGTEVDDVADETGGLHLIRVRMLRITLLFLVVFGLPFCVEAVIRFAGQEAWGRLGLNVGLYLAAVGLLVLRNRAAYRWQAFGLVTVFFLWSANVMRLYGFTGIGLYALFILPIFTAVLVDATRAVWAIAAGAATIGFTWFGVTSGWLTLTPGTFGAPETHGAWLSALVVYVVWTLLISACLHVVQRRLIDSREDALHNARELKRANAELSAEIRRREESETELEKSREQLQQSQRLEAIGRLAGGVAHDFNNLLTSIDCSTGLVLDNLPAQGALRAEVEEIAKASRRAADLVQQLLTFSRQQPHSPRIIQPNVVLDDAWKMLRRIIGENVDLAFRPSRDLGCIKADPAQLEQVLVNLAVNARDAMPDGGRLTVETRNTRVERSARDTLDGLNPGDYVVISVTDTGRGMDAQTKSVIFEPFFTTKNRDEGTGLGLSTVYGILHQNGGGITVDSEPGEGSTFSVYLPRVSGRPDARIELAAPRGKAVGTETILLVEDEVRVRRVARRALERRGYRVIEAHDGASACARFEECHDGIDILLTDIVMPNMNGRELYERLVKKAGDLPVLFMSGYTDDIVKDIHSLPSRGGFIHKPFSSQALAHKLRSVLDG